MDNAYDSISLDCKASMDEDGSALVDFVADDCDLMDNLELVVRSDYIDQMLNTLDPIDRQIVGGILRLKVGTR